MLQRHYENFVQDHIDTQENHPFGQGGAIGLYELKSTKGFGKKEEVMMRLFPLEENALGNLFPAQSDRVKLLEVLSRPQSYESFQHKKHFADHHANGKIGFQTGASLSHLILDFAGKNTITYDPVQGIVFDPTAADNKSSYIPWTQFLTKIDGYHQSHRRKLNHLLFPSGMARVLVVPIPVLTTPTFLYFIPGDCIQDYGSKWINNFVGKLAISAAESVHSFLYNSLLNSFKQHIDFLSINTEYELFLQFVKELSNILLPVEYTIGEDDPVKQVNWYEKGNGHTFDFHIDVREEGSYHHKLLLRLPQYRIPASPSNYDAAYQMGQWLDEVPDFDLRVDRVRVTLNNIYSLAHRAWRATEQQRQRYEQEIKPLVTRLETGYQTLLDAREQIKKLLEEGVQPIESIGPAIDQLTKEVRMLRKGVYHSDYEFYQQLNGEFVFTFEGKRRDALRWKGLEHLHAIMEGKGELTWNDILNVDREQPLRKSAPKVPSNLSGYSFSEEQCFRRYEAFKNAIWKHLLPYVAADGSSSPRSDYDKRSFSVDWVRSLNIHPDTGGESPLRHHIRILLPIKDQMDIDSSVLRGHRRSFLGDDPWHHPMAHCKEYVEFAFNQLKVLEAELLKEEIENYRTHKMKPPRREPDQAKEWLRERKRETERAIKHLIDSYGAETTLREYLIESQLVTAQKNGTFTILESPSRELAHRIPQFVPRKALHWQFQPPGKVDESIT